MVNIDPQKKEVEFNKFLVSQYLKYGSVDAVLKKHYYSLPISPASYHRLLDKRGIVKAAGPHGKISEAMAFMEYLAEEKLPLEQLYKKLPPSFETSKITLHRIYNHIKRGVTRRAATGLIITMENDPQKVLLAKDLSMPRLVYGKKKGAFSIPLTFSKAGEDRRVSVKRVLQQEVFSDQVVEDSFPCELLQKDLQLVLEIKILDISLKIYHLEIPEKIASKLAYSSFRMSEHAYAGLSEIEELASLGKLRSGVYEITNFYKKGILSGEATKAQVALVNQQLQLDI